MRLSRTGTPGLSTGLVASLLAHSVRLALVLGHAGVDGPARMLAMILRFVVDAAGLCVLDNIRADRGLEDVREGEGVAASGAIGAVDGHGRAGRHVCCVVSIGLSCTWLSSTSNFHCSALATI